MQTIPAAVSFDIRKTEVRELPLPDITADAGLLRIEMTGVCGSDWPYYLKYPKTKGALVLGHESVGRIESLGRDAGRRFGLKEGDRVELRGFGAFSAKARNARMGRNPRTGESVEVVAKRVPFFKTGKELRERLNLPKA